MRISEGKWVTFIFVFFRRITGFSIREKRFRIFFPPFPLPRCAQKHSTCLAFSSILSSSYLRPGKGNIDIQYFLVQIKWHTIFRNRFNIGSRRLFLITKRNRSFQLAAIRITNNFRLRTHGWLYNIFSYSQKEDLQTHANNWIKREHLTEDETSYNFWKLCQKVGLGK